MLYSGKSGSIRAVVVVFDKNVVFGENGCIRAKMVVFGQSGCVLEKVIVFLQSGCFRLTVVVFGQKWLYSE